MRNGTKSINGINNHEQNMVTIKSNIVDTINMAIVEQFYQTGRISKEALESLYSESTLEFLEQTGIVEKDDQFYYTEFNCTLFEGFVIFSDPDITDELQAPLYVDPLWDKYLSKLIIRDKVDHSLDMGGGSGIISLVLSKFSKQVTYVDINERAIGLAKMNAFLNSVSNITFVHGDLFDNVPEMLFDYIVFNSPTDKEGTHFVRLLETGEQILKRFFDNALVFLKPNGICQVSMGMFDEELNGFEKINTWLGSEHLKKLYLIAMEETINLKLWRRMHLTLINTPGLERFIRFSYSSISDEFDGNISSSFIKELVLRE